MYTQEYINKVKLSMPELPQDLRSRLLSRGLSERDVDYLMVMDAGRGVLHDGKLAQGFVSYFEQVAEKCDTKAAFNWYA